MSTTPSPVFFAEQNDFALLLARGAAVGRTLRLESLVEIPHTNATALAEAVRRSLPAGATILCALRPGGRNLHLSTGAEAAAHAGLAGVHRFAQSLPDFSGGPVWTAASRARDGTAPDGTPWLLATAAGEAHEQSLAALATLGLKPARTFSAIHQAVGAAVALATTPTLLVEVGEHQAHALVVGPGGVLTVAPVSLSLDCIAEAVQAELGMKFRGSAVKLFLNPDYDFTEAAAKIAARLTARLKSEISALPGAKPGTLACSGLPAAQQWLTHSLAASLDLAVFAPDLKAWCNRAGTTFASAELESSLSPAWAGFLHLANTSQHDTMAWQASWQSAPSSPTAPAAKASAAPATPAARTPAASPSPAPAKPAAVPSPVISVKTVPAPKPAAPVPAAKPAAPVPVARATVPASTAPAKAALSAAPVAKATVPDSAVSYPPRPAPAGKPQPKKQPDPAPAKSVIAAATAKSSPPPPANKSPAKPASPTPPPAPAQPRSSRNLLRGLALAAVVVLAIGGGLFWQAQRESAARAAVEQAKLEAERLAETERKRLAAEQARIEAETRRKIELENTQKVAAQEAARQQAENEARIAAAIRLVNARGALSVGGPAGATVTVGDLPPRTAPATFTDLKLGRHTVTVSQPHHETVTLELDVKENVTTDAGPVRLARVVGTLILTSEPGDANYEIRPANTITLSPDSVRQGRTPVTFDDIVPGDYVVTFTRDGWQPHTETVTVGRDSTVRAACAFRTGIVKLTTTPAGAAVSLAGVAVGVTPLTLAEQNPGAVTFELTLAGHDPETVEARIESGQILNISRTLEPEDRIVRLTDADQRPVAILTPQPEITTQGLESPLRVDIVLTVDRNGNPRDLVLSKAPSPEIGKLCLAAAEKWKFKPATVNGKPVNVRVVVPFTIVAP
ncbi:MAG: PEGA domain-containing protein [Opitutaceae bacterium]|nr:PEGA domain-containing protein [Opitutaceae bacterium]